MKVWKAYAEFEAARIPLREEDREDEEEEDEEGYTPDYDGTPVPGSTPYAGTSTLPGSSSLSNEILARDDLEDSRKATERSPLLRRSTSRSRRRRPSVGPHGDATVTQAVLMVCAT